MNTQIVRSEYSGAQTGKPRVNLGLKWFCLAGLFCLGASGPLVLAQTDKIHRGSPDFERMKALAGTWKGKADMGQGPMEFTAEYRVISGGSAVEERIFAGTPKE